MLSRDEQLMVDFIRQCLQIDPTSRIQCEEALRHDWFKDLLIETEREIDLIVQIESQRRNELDVQEEDEEDEDS